MYPFHDLGEIHEALERLEEHAEGAFVVELPRQPGHKENRFTHLFCGEPEIEVSEPILEPEPAMLQVRAENERFEAFEQELESLREELQELRSSFESFKGQFE